MSTCIKCNAPTSALDGRCPSCNASAPATPGTTATAPAGTAQLSSWPWPTEDHAAPQQRHPFLHEIHLAAMEHQKKAQKWLMVFAILAAGGGLLMAAMLAGTPGADGAASTFLVIGLVAGAFYFAMWMWSHSNIVAAATVSIFISIADILISLVTSLVTSPLTTGLGLLLKVFFISAMARAIRAAHDERYAKLA